MSDERHLPPVIDASTVTEVDRDLAQLLSIAPSAEFALQVRTRIREHASARHSSAPWWIGVAAAAAVAILVLFGSRAWRMGGAPREVRAARDTVVPPVVARPEIRAGVPATNARRTAHHAQPRVASVTPGATGVGLAQPVVMVSRDQLRAIARLQDLIRSGDLTEKNSPPVGSAPNAITEIQVAPLTIVPLTVPAVEIIGGVAGSRSRSER